MIRIRAQRALNVAALGVAAVLALTACAGPDAEELDSPGPAPEAFSGPWAELFELTYAEASSDEERAALKDGEISAQEYAYFQDKIVECLAALDVTATFRSDGALEYSNPDRVSQDAIGECNAENGIRVLTLRDTIARNPTNVDENELVVDCLQREGVVDEDYTAEDLENGIDIREIGQSEEFAGCVGDPYNYGKN
jgi:hypothetical protein